MRKMKSVKHILNCMMIVGVGTLAFGIPAQGKTKEMWACLHAWLPPGAKEEEKGWYDTNTRCENSQKIPQLDRATCTQTLSELKRTSQRLTKLVEDACEKYIPRLQARGCSFQIKDSQCINQTRAMFQDARKFMKGFDEELAQMQPQLKRFSKINRDTAERYSRLGDYHVRMKLNLDPGIANEVKYGKGGSFDKTPPGRQFTRDTGGVPPSQFEKVYGDDKPSSGEVKSITKRFDSDISGSGPDTIPQRSKALDQSWRDLQQVRSPLIQEQLTNHLEAEEMRLALDQYRQDLAKVQTQISTMEAKSTKTLEHLESLTPLVSFASAKSESSRQVNPAPAAPAESPGVLARAAATPASSPNKGAGDGGHIGRAGSFIGGGDEEDTAFNFTFSKIRDYSQPEQEAKAPAVLAKASGSPTAGSVSIPELAPKAGKAKIKASALREALRRKLARGGKASAAELAALKDAEAEEAAEEKLAASDRDAESSSGASRFPASLGGSGGGDDLLGSFGGGLDTGGFSFGGVEAEASARDIVSDFEEALAESQHEPLDYIGNRESSPLFERVKHYHDRCLRSGCVSLRIK